MAFDPRQVVAAFLTLSMFAMLGNMIKKDHFDSNEVKHPTLAVQFDVMKVEEHISMEKKGPWMEKSSALKSYWNRPASKEGDKGFITFSLTTGPEYHFSQKIEAKVDMGIIYRDFCAFTPRGQPNSEHVFRELEVYITSIRFLYG